MPPSVVSSLVPHIIHAKDASPAAIADAFLRQAAETRYGPPPMIVIPPEAPGSRARVVPPRPVPSAPPMRSPLDRIRALNTSIAGYACVFNRVNHRREAIAPGAFRRALRSDQFFLLLDHLNGHDDNALSLASKRAGTLHIEEDRVGLWFEASLADDRDGTRLFKAIHHGFSSGISWSGTITADRFVDGLRIIETIDAWEISVLFPPNQPRFAAWVMANRKARQRRRLEL